MNWYNFKESFINGCRYGPRHWISGARSYYKNKRRANEFMVGDIVEDCSYHAVVVTELSYDVYGADVEGFSIHTGRGSSCSLNHCGIVKLDEQEIINKIKAFNESGDRGLAILAGWTEEQHAEFERNWRPEKAQDDVAVQA